MPVLEHRKNLWVKLAFIGFGIVLAINVIWPVSVWMLPTPDLNILSVVTSLMLLGQTSTLLIYLYIFATIILYFLLKRLIEYPITVALFVGFTLCSIHVLVNKVSPPVGFASELAGFTVNEFEIFRPVLIGVFVSLIAALLLPFASYTATTIRSTTKRLIIFFVITFTAGTAAIMYPDRPFVLTSRPNVNEVSWSILPGEVPPWLKEYGPLNQASCDREPVNGNSWYKCNYYFTNFPGYLTRDSQIALANGQDKLSSLDVPSSSNTYAPSPFFNMVVARDDSHFDSYKFRNGKCDWLNLQNAATSLRSSDGKVVQRILDKIPSEPKACAHVTTPAGRQLYYESYLNYPESIVAQVPVRFYFEHRDVLVILEVNTNAIRARSLTSVFVTDSNFQPEVFKFVDSF